jgi:hypothetical protein
MPRRLRDLAVVTLAAAALTLPAPGAVAAPAFTAQRAAAGALPKAAIVKDYRGDGESRRFDIFWVRGATVGENLVFTMKVRNITPANVRWVKDEDGFHWKKAFFTVYLRVNGKRQTAYTVGNDFRGLARLIAWKNNEPAVGGDMDCNPDPAASDNGTTTRYNFKRNIIRLAVPRTCLPEVRRIAVSGISLDDWGHSFGGKSDYVNNKPGGFHEKDTRHSDWFAAR